MGCSNDRQKSVELVRELMRQLGVSPHELFLDTVVNPYVQLDVALTRKDITQGARLLVVGHQMHKRADEIVVDFVVDDDYGHEMIVATNGIRYSIADCGIHPRLDGSWNPCYATFRNDRPTRQVVAEWLANKGGEAAKSAALILKQHPEDWRTEVVVKDGKILATFEV